MPVIDKKQQSVWKRLRWETPRNVRDVLDDAKQVP
jgi:hypothetical protein